MPMNHRLMRPLQTLHPEALDWRNRVRTNGGSVSSTTLTAVDRFVKAIHAAGIRDRFYRLNLFCGNSDASLNAVRTPLFRGQSLGGTQFGNAMDTAFNFVQGDYSEASGLIGNDNAAKYLNTGLPLNTATTPHVSAYITSYAGYYARVIGVEGTQGFAVTTDLPPNVVYGIVSTSAFSNVGSNGVPRSAGLHLFTNTASPSQVFYFDAAASAGTGARSVPTTSLPVFVFTANNNGSPRSTTPCRIAGYSIGESVTAAQVAAYNTAMKAFQSALGRPTP